MPITFPECPSAELLAKYEGERVTYTHGAIEVIDRNGRVSHRRKTKSTLHNRDGVPCVKRRGRWEPVVANYIHTDDYQSKFPAFVRLEGLRMPHDC